MIDPKQIIEKYSVEELNQTAEKYFSAIDDPTYLLTKPLSGFFEAPELLQNVGLLFSGAELNKSMTVLDFAAGTCWLSYYLAQLQCKTISCDVSQTALDIGKSYFDNFPMVKPAIAEPQFLLFDGLTINLPDNSVDRILCNDGFHHIPNQKTVLAEFSRILKDGGIVGFSEPGRMHSKTPQSQHEMKNYVVLENDILINEIYDQARSVGFSDIKIKLMGDVSVSIREYNFFTHPWMIRLLTRFFPRVVGPLLNKTIFFLYKGDRVLDSRGHTGLKYEMAVPQNEFTGAVNQNIDIPLVIKNSGRAIWLATNFVDIGIVKIGTNLLDVHENIISTNFSRDTIEKQILPGETLQQSIRVSFPEKGVYRLGIDLLSEDVIWFKLFGSKQGVVTINVE